MSAAMLTEPERRRAAGESPFCACDACVYVARELTEDVALYGRRVSTGAVERVAVMLRAIVQQALVDRIVAWCEEAAT